MYTSGKRPRSVTPLDVNQRPIQFPKPNEPIQPAGPAAFHFQAQQLAAPASAHFQPPFPIHAYQPPAAPAYRSDSHTVPTTRMTTARNTTAPRMISRSLFLMPYPSLPSTNIS